LQTAEGSQRIIRKAKACSVTEGQAYLSKHGLALVNVGYQPLFSFSAPTDCCPWDKNAFWELSQDPYRMVGFDKLHALDQGLWGHHTWPLTKGIVKALGSLISSKVETR
jgi:hypothetical protein